MNHFPSINKEHEVMKENSQSGRDGKDCPRLGLGFLSTFFFIMIELAMMNEPSVAFRLPRQ